ncbi:hypothetical protein EVAR_32262_1 [Eumeta japonica]|uniref:Uncharacterized protein n=1 Tax=Eumeta variegata TaxID=151549 RepID=A0A4C1X0C6_EUMVA|nr:hypothetical protein EVAR_32262_1 [Eumeta japonica]
MDILQVLQTLAWCKSDWFFPSVTNETNKLIQQCLSLPPATISDDVNEIIKKSNEFPIPFPVESVRLQSLRARRPLENLKRNIASTYPLIHERVLLLMAHFLIYKREYGTSIEKALYKDMSVPDLVDRMLKKRAVSFLGAHDEYQLLNGEYGYEGWESVGTLHQKPPLVLEDCLSYDEMKLSAMVFVSGYTEFINDGARRNSGVIQEENIEKDGVIIGLVGARLEKKLKMEYEDLLITDEQNTFKNGYGQEIPSTPSLENLKTTFVSNNESSRHMWRQLWSEFYQVHSYTYDELTSSVNVEETSDKKLKYTDRYVKKPHTGEIFDNEVFYKRLIIPFDCTLLEANERAKAEGKMAFVNVVGIGLGVWRAMPHQNDVFILAFLERIKYFLKEEVLDHISNVNFAYIRLHNSIQALFVQNTTSQDASQEKKMFLESEKHPNGGIYVQLENREPSAKLPAEHAGKLLVTTYAWDGNAHPGNEFWLGTLTASGDPAAACSTQVAELHNAHINGAVCARNLRVAGRFGVLTLQEYSKKLL